MPVEKHTITFSWIRTSDLVVLGTCNATLKKMSTYWRLEVPAFQLTGITVAGGDDVYAKYDDTTSLLFGTAATVWMAYSNLIQTGNVSAATGQGFFKLDHSSTGAGIVRILPYITVNDGTKATSAYVGAQFAFGPGDLHVYTEMVFEIQAVAV
jgi:hypothetical protein